VGLAEAREALGVGPGVAARAVPVGVPVPAGVAVELGPVAATTLIGVAGCGARDPVSVSATVPAATITAIAIA
jgi:hypothetical protein